MRGVRDVTLGSAGLFLALYPTVRPAFLSDVDPDIVELHTVIRDHAVALMEVLDRHQRAFDAAAKLGKAAFDEVFYRIRNVSAEVLATWSPVERAARTIVSSKAGMNGLYRKNQSGALNVPVGRRSDHADGSMAVPRLYKPENMLRLAKTYRGVVFFQSDLVPAIDAALPGEVLLSDPPYDPLKPGGFTAYSGKPFTPEDQARTASALRRAARRGVHVMSANHDTGFIRQLYADFELHTVFATRSLSRDVASRGILPELLIVGRPG